MDKKKCVPDVRLTKFDSKWIEHAVGELLAERVDLSPKSDEYPLMAFVANQGIVPKGERYDRSALVTDTENKLYKKTELGDFIYSSNNLESGSIGLNNYGKATISPVYSIFAPTELGVSSFLGRRLVRSDFIREMVKWRQGVIYGQWRIHESDFERIIVKVPSVDEQTEIGTFLQQADNLALCNQKKLDKLYNIRAAMLEKMFPKGNENVPKVRFQEFSGSWEKHKVGDFLTESRIIGHTGLTAKKLTVKLWGKGVVEKSDVYGGSTHTQYYVRKAGQFMYGKLDFLHAAFGIVPDSLDGYESTLDSPAFDLSGIDGRFLMNTVIQENFYLKNGMIANGSRKAKRIHADTFLEMDILVPDIEEQKKIGDYFSQLDKQISFAQLEISKLQNLKKALLEKMFV